MPSNQTADADGAAGVAALLTQGHAALSRLLRGPGDHAAGQKVAHALDALAAQARAAEALRVERDNARRVWTALERTHRETLARLAEAERDTERAHREARIAMDRRDEAERRVAAAVTLRPESEWREENGEVLWWAFPVTEAPYVGTPLDSRFPSYVTHWTPITVPAAPAGGEGGDDAE